MIVRASAPGKLVILGEYAVLEGAPALVQACGARAEAHIEPIEGDHSELLAPQVLDAPARFQLTSDGLPSWADALQRDRAILVDQMLRAMAAAGRAIPASAAMRLVLDTSGFFERNGGAKYGLGSSAALSVALAAALTEYLSQVNGQSLDPPQLSELLAFHRNFQGGHGSGVDLAAAHVGGLIAYRLDAEDQPDVRKLSWPTGLYPVFVWSGQSASTGSFLRRLSEWRQSHPSDYAAHFKHLASLAAAGVEAVGRGDALGFLGVCGDYVAALQKLGEEATIDILSASHRRIQALVTAVGGVYKPCGAGGGDLGVALSADPEQAFAIRSRLEQAGIGCPDINFESDGLRVQTCGVLS